MTTIKSDLLANVCGGMRLDTTLPPGDVQDLRGETRRQARERLRNAPPLPPPPQIGPRHPNDLPHQAGLDDIHAPRGRRR
jgi:hypothetical protein